MLCETKFRILIEHMCELARILCDLEHTTLLWFCCTRAPLAIILNTFDIEQGLAILLNFVFKIGVSMDIIDNLIFKFTLLKNSSPTSMFVLDEDVPGIMNYDLQLDNEGCETTEVSLGPHGSVGLQCTSLQHTYWCHVKDYANIR